MIRSLSVCGSGSMSASTWHDCHICHHQSESRSPELGDRRRFSPHEEFPSVGGHQTVGASAAVGVPCSTVYLEEVGTTASLYSDHLRSRIAGDVSFQQLIRAIFAVGYQHTPGETA